MATASAPVRDTAAVVPLAPTTTTISTHARAPPARRTPTEVPGLSACIEIVIDLSKHGRGFGTNRKLIYKAAKLARQLAGRGTLVRGVQKKATKRTTSHCKLGAASASTPSPASRASDRGAELVPRPVSTDGQVMRRVCNECTESHRSCTRDSIKDTCKRCSLLGLDCETSAVKW